MTVCPPEVRNEVRDCTRPDADVADAEAALARLLASHESGEGEGDRTPAALARRSHLLVRMARHYGSSPFTPLRELRRELDVGRPELARLLGTFTGVPELRDAVCAAPAGKYWTNTVLPLERRGVFDAVLDDRPSLPVSVGLYPGPTCMFRCHFCVRVTGARYDAGTLVPGNETLARLVDEVPTTDPGLLYVSGGLEPLTNPGLGELVSRAAGRGFRITMYSNAFALTEQTLERQPGLWDLHAVRTSLYGLGDDEYEATVSKGRAFSRVRDNLARFLRTRAEQDRHTRLGLNYLILPGRARRLLDLVDFMCELGEESPHRPLDFLNLRQDYSGRDDGQLSASDRDELRESLRTFDERVAERLPGLDVDYGYALNSLRDGVPAELLRITPDQMRPKAHPQVAVQVDLLGDVYLYREAGFPDLPGARRYIAGRLGPGRGLADVIGEFVRDADGVDPHPGDEFFLDGFDQVVTARLNQLEDDLRDGWGAARGFLS